MDRTAWSSIAGEMILSPFDLNQLKSINPSTQTYLLAKANAIYDAEDNLGLAPRTISSFVKIFPSTYVHTHPIDHLFTVVLTHAVTYFIISPPLVHPYLRFVADTIPPYVVNATIDLGKNRITFAINEPLSLSR